ncbi:MAG: M18 family aminopeptidase [Pseudobutyrivibrio sp.]|nr:M18 family aminopeptidase [Pseudobutyrivibrio sp.]
MKKTNKALFEFLNNSPSQFHAIANQAAKLEEAGYKRLLEQKPFKLEAGGKYFVTRNNSSLIAFRIPKKEYQSFMVMASHSDSPTFRIKENPEMVEEKHFVKLNCEKYGGMLMATWFDRPLSIAGRILVKDEKTGAIKEQLVNIDKNLVMIPSLAIHMNREANEGYKYNAQKDTLPLMTMDADIKLMDVVAKEAGVSAESIIGKDLFLYNRDKATLWGAKDEFISSGRIDDLECAFASLEGFLEAKDNKSAITMHCVFDNEEVGSGTKQGADSTFLSDVMERINEALGFGGSKLKEAIASSMMLSADNAHSVHPNYGEKSDPTNRVYMNEGIVIKYNANQKYTTDGVSAALFTEICKAAEVPTQVFVNRSDSAGGSTLGNISTAHVSLNSVDIGLAQLSMHSCFETAGAKDAHFMVLAATKFFESHIEISDMGIYNIK